jgi:regulator of protease activity HflC (stomatin/prohibitin superfamily)
MERNKQVLFIVAIVAILIIVLFGSKMFKMVQPGERAIIFRKYTSGLDRETQFQPGFHLVAPWNDFIKYDVKEQKREETLDVLDKNGLTLNVDVFIGFNPVYDRIAYLHEMIGTDYVGVVVIPEMRSSVRRVMGKFNAEEIYSTQRAKVEEDITSETRNALAAKNIQMQTLLIRSVKLPEQLKASIESKLKQEQEALAYQFRLDREVSEAERKRIEADGIARYNNIINSSLSDRILKQRGIDATVELAKSENSKVIVIGTGDKGLPVILDAK